MDTQLLETESLVASNVIRAQVKDLAEVCRRLMAGTLEEAYALDPPAWGTSETDLRRGMNIALKGDQPKRVTAIKIDLATTNQKNIAGKKDRFEEVGPVLIAPTFKDPETGEMKPDLWVIVAFEFEGAQEGMTLIAKPLSSAGEARLAEMAQGANAILTSPDDWLMSRRGAKATGPSSVQSTGRGDDPTEYEVFDRYAAEKGLSNSERDEMVNQFMRQDEVDYPEQFLKGYEKVHFKPDRKPHGKEGANIKLVAGPPPALAGVANIEAHDLEKLSQLLQSSGMTIASPVAAKYLPPEKFRVLLGPGLAPMAMAESLHEGLVAATVPKEHAKTAAEALSTGGIKFKAVRVVGKDEVVFLISDGDLKKIQSLNTDDEEEQQPKSKGVVGWAKDKFTKADQWVTGKALGVADKVGLGGVARGGLKAVNAINKFVGGEGYEDVTDQLLTEREEFSPPEQSIAQKFDRDMKVSQGQARDVRAEWEAPSGDVEELAAQLGTIKGFDVKLFGGGNGPEKYLATEAQARGYEMKVGKKAGGGRAVRVRLAETPHFALLAPVNLPGQTGAAGVLGLLWTDSGRVKKMQDTGGIRSTLTIPVEAPTEQPDETMTDDQLAMYLYFSDEVPQWAFGRSMRGGGRSGQGHGGPATPGDNAFTLLYKKRRIGNLIRERGIWAIAPSLRQEPAATADLEAETVKKALEAIQDGEYDVRKSAFHTWITNIARNTTKSMLKQQATRGETTFDPSTPPVPVGGGVYRLSPDAENLGDSQTFRGALGILTERAASSFQTAAAQTPAEAPEVRAPVTAPSADTPVKPSPGILGRAAGAVQGLWNYAVRDPFLQSGEKQLGAQTEIDRRLAFEPETQAGQTMTGEEVEAELKELEASLKSAKDAVTTWEDKVKERFKDLKKFVDIDTEGWAVDTDVLFRLKKAGSDDVRDPLADTNARRLAAAALVRLVVDGVLGVQMTGQFTYLMENIHAVLDNVRDVAVYMLGVPAHDLQGAETSINTADRKFSELEKLAPELLRIDRITGDAPEQVQAYKELFSHAVRAVGLMLGALGNAVDGLGIVVTRARKIGGTKITKNQRFIRRFAKPQDDLGIGSPTAGLTPTDERIVSDVFQRYMTQYTGFGQYRGEMVWPWGADATDEIRAQFKDRSIENPTPAQMAEINRRIELDMDDRITFYVAQVFRDAGKTAVLGLPDVLEAFGKEELPVREPSFRTRVFRTFTTLVRGGYLEGAGDQQSPYTDRATYPVYKATTKLDALVKSYK